MFPRSFFAKFKKKPKNKDSKILITILICAMLISASIIYLGVQISKATPSANPANQSTTARQETIEDYLTNAVADVEHDDAILGNPKAPVTIIEYSDYQCPFCRSYYENAYQEIKENYIDKQLAKMIFKDFPLSFHEDALFAANAAECARAETRSDAIYYHFHDQLFEAQGPFTRGTVPITNQMVDDIAKKLKVNSKSFQQCLDNKQFYLEVAGDYLAGLQHQAARIAEYNPETQEPHIRAATADEINGVNATPTVFINDIKISGAQPFELFQYAIEAELKSHPSNQ